MLDGPRMVRTEVARNAVELRRHRETWARLVRFAVEPNVFYEPGPFLAALDHLKPDRSFTALLIYGSSGQDRKSASSLIGFIPFERVGRGRTRWLERLQLYTHIYCFLSTPLIHRDWVDETIDALIGWISSRPDGLRLFDFRGVGADGPIWAALERGLTHHGLPHRTQNRFQRALFLPAGNSREFLRSAISARHRKELRRQRNRLADLGEVRVREFGPADVLDDWLIQFLQLESSGWKAHAFEAIAETEGRRRFFRVLIQQAKNNDSLLMQSLDLNGRPVAQKCSLRSMGAPDQAFAFKIAYDEGFAKFSPGVQLEVEHIDLLHRIRPSVTWMDSCANPNHPMIDRLWPGRRSIGRLLVATSGALGQGLLQALFWRASGR